MAFPPAHLFVGAGVGELLGARTRLPPWKAWTVGAAFAILPDSPTLVQFALGMPAADHGLITHNLVALLLVAVLAGYLSNPRIGVLAGAAYASHLLVDLLRDGGTSVFLAWPFSAARMDGLYPLFPTVPFESGGGLLGERPELFGPNPLGRLLEQTLIGVSFFLAALLIVRVRRIIGRRSSPVPR